MSLEFGKQYTWKEIADVYPDMYAIFKDDVFDPVEGVISCVLLGICPYEERDRALADAVKQYGKVGIRRTTEGDPFFNGVIFW